ncbi:hypothetical protein [Flavobacterium sp. JP2137]|uniref:hypothetical protein n=1 Tax=Flavobacterium sp. JP2137 TaxID=3414510 RepID=UPI003D2FD76F
MRNLVLFFVCVLYLSCGNKTGEEFFFQVENLSSKDFDLLEIKKVKLYYLSNLRKDKNSLCFEIKIYNSQIRSQIKTTDFSLFYAENKFEYIAMFPPAVSAEDTVFICFSQDEMRGAKLDSIFNSMEKVHTNKKIQITKDIIKDVKLYLYFENKDSIAVPLSEKTLFSFYLRDKSMMNVY